MIKFLHGEIVIHPDNTSCIVITGGVGYGVEISSKTAEALLYPGEGYFTVTGQTGCRELVSSEGKPSTRRLHISTVYQENAVTLFGFVSWEERELFDTIYGKVQGVGPRKAFDILAGMTCDEFKTACRESDTKAFRAVPGVGPKVAEKLILEFRDKFGPPSKSVKPAPPAGIPSAVLADVKAALVGMGYKAKEVDITMQAKLAGAKPETTISELIKLCLKK